MAGRYVPTLAQFGSMKKEDKEFEVQFLEKKVLDLKEKKNRTVWLRRQAEEGRIQGKDISQINSFAIDLTGMLYQEIKALGKEINYNKLKI